MRKQELINRLKEKQLRVTPQRLAILEAIIKLNNHPTAENIITYIKKNHPTISIGAVYKILDSLVEADLLKRVKTENGIMRYDPFITKHHHLYCADSDKIEDYEDEELDQIISDYFKKKEIKNFQINDIKLQISGKFKN